jgi:hypothetical protein
MDIISGVVVTTSVFLAAAALTSLFIAWRVGHSMKLEDGTFDADPRFLERLVESRARSVLTTLLIVYFVATTNLLVVAQQLGIALFNMAAGVILVVGMYLTGVLWSGSDERDHWRR